MSQQKEKTSKKSKKSEFNAKQGGSDTETDKSSTSPVLDITTLAEYEQLKTELDIANEKIKETLELAKIYKADMERIRERSKVAEAELEEKLTIDIAKRFLIVQDNFEKSFEHISDENDLRGFKLIYQSLVDSLKKIGIEKIDVDGKDFDADTMNSIMTETAPNKEMLDKVAKVFAEGYVYLPTNKIVRYAQVSIYK